MIGRYSLALCSLIAAVSGMNGIAKDEDAASVSIQCMQSEVKSGTEVKVNFTVVNTSDHELWLDKVWGKDGHAEDFNIIEVRDGSGKQQPRIDAHTVMIGGKPHTLPNGSLLRIGHVLLKPGEKLEDFATLSNLFDLGKPGEYSITTKIGPRYNDPDSGIQWYSAKSNTIVIHVTR